MKETKKFSGWSLVFVILAAVLLVAAIYMLIATIQYIKSYIGYGYSFADVGGAQTIISAVVPYIFYAFASFGIALVLKQVLPAKVKKVAEPEIAAAAALPEVEEEQEEESAFEAAEEIGEEEGVIEE